MCIGFSAAVSWCGCYSVRLWPETACLHKRCFIGEIWNTHPLLHAVPTHVDKSPCHSCCQGAFKDKRRRRNLALTDWIWWLKIGRWVLTWVLHWSTRGRRVVKQQVIRLEIVLYSMCLGLLAAQWDCNSCPTSISVLITWTQVLKCTGHQAGAPRLLHYKEGSSAHLHALRRPVGANCCMKGVNFSCSLK